MVNRGRHGVQTFCVHMYWRPRFFHSLGVDWSTRNSEHAFLCPYAALAVLSLAILKDTNSTFFENNEVGHHF